MWPRQVAVYSRPRYSRPTPARSITASPTSLLFQSPLRDSPPPLLHASQFYCLADPRSCSKRFARVRAAAGRNPTAAAAAGLDAFLLSELATGDGGGGGGTVPPGESSLSLMLQAHERLAALLKEGDAQAAGLRRQQGGATGGIVCSTSAPPLSVLHSKYEHMVSDFDGWLSALLAPLPLGLARSSSLHAQLARRYRGDVSVGRQRASVGVGANMGRLQPETLSALRERVPRLGALMQELGYLWEAPFVVG